MAEKKRPAGQKKAATNQKPAAQRQAEAQRQAAAGHRAAQAESLNVEDALSRSEAFLIKNQKPIIGAVIAVVVIVAAIVLYKNYYVIPREEKAQAALFKGQTYFEAEEYELALNGDSIDYAGLLAVTQNYGGTDAANLAQAYAGLCYAHLGQYDEAIKALDKFSGVDRLVTPAIKAAMGNCYAQTGNLDKAASLLLKAAQEANSDALSPIWYLQAGQILLEQGKNAEAIKALTAITEQHAGSYLVSQAEKYIAIAETKQ